MGAFKIYKEAFAIPGILLALALAPAIAICSGEDPLAGFADHTIEVQPLDARGKPVGRRHLDALHFDEESGGYIWRSAPDEDAFIWALACLKANGPCQRRGDATEALRSGYARTHGLKNLSPALLQQVKEQLEDIEKHGKNFATSTETKISADGTKLEIAITYLQSGRSVTNRYLIRKIPGVSEAPVQFFDTKLDCPFRFPYTGAEAFLKNYGDAVAKIVYTPPEDQDNPNDEGHGTGFFLNAEGLLYTNHHVLNLYPECMQKLECTITLVHTLRDGKEVPMDYHATVYAYDRAEDFAVLKFDLPQNHGFSFLKVGSGEIPRAIVSLGYHGDVDRLVYSFGNPTGYSNREIATNMYAIGGASGGPAINLNTGEAFAIVSDVAIGNSNRTAPGLIRPLSVIQSKFGIFGYINGEKQRRIDGILLRLRNSKNAAEANAALREYMAERTFYGINQVTDLLANHANAGVRREILQAIRANDMILGK